MAGKLMSWAWKAAIVAAAVATIGLVASAFRMPALREDARRGVPPRPGVVVGPGVRHFVGAGAIGDDD